MGQGWFQGYGAVEAQGPRPADLKMAVIQADHTHFLLCLAGSRPDCPWLIAMTIYFGVCPILSWELSFSSARTG